MNKINNSLPENKSNKLSKKCQENSVLINQGIITQNTQRKPWTSWRTIPQSTYKITSRDSSRIFPSMKEMSGLETRFLTKNSTESSKKGLWMPCKEPIAPSLPEEQQQAFMKNVNTFWKQRKAKCNFLISWK